MSKKKDATKADELPAMYHTGHCDTVDQLDSLVRAVDRLIQSGLTIPAGNVGQIHAMSALLAEMDSARPMTEPPF